MEAHGPFVVTHFHFITYALCPPPPPPFPLSTSPLPLLFPSLPSPSSPTARHHILFLIAVLWSESVKREKKREREETPHDRIAKLKARHKPFYTPTRFSLALARPIIRPSASSLLSLLSLSPSPPFSSYPPPLPPGANPFSFFSPSTISPPFLPSPVLGDELIASCMPF